MSLRYGMAGFVGLFLKAVLKRLGRGSALPGKWALKIDPDFLYHAASPKTILVTGTNGKTMTTNLLVQSLQEAGIPVRTNSGGANMVQGLATALLGLPKEKKWLCVLEVDEATMPLVAKDLQADMVVLTNLFQDQSERYANPKVTLSLIQKALEDLPQANIVANGEVPLFHPQSLGRQAVTYGLGAKAMAGTGDDEGECPACGGGLTYLAHAYADLGTYACPACGLQAPDLDVALDGPPDLGLGGSSFSIDGQVFCLPAAGLYNVVNALGAYAAGKTLGLPRQAMVRAFGKVGAIGGRQESLVFHDKTLTLHLMKNPVGFDQIVRLLELEEEAFGLVLLLNDRPADGMDISWIKDGDFSGLLALTQGHALVGGLRGKDLQEHLLSQGGRAISYFATFEEMEKLLGGEGPGRVHVLATYTALGEIQSWLKGRGGS